MNGPLLKSVQDLTPGWKNGKAELPTWKIANFWNKELQFALAYGT